MTPDFDEVLLTAYLDGEVTATERAAVEDQLKKSASTRQLFEELRSIRNMVTHLHLAQPSGNWRKGPWNTTNESPAVSLRPIAPAMHWKATYQRFASLAALIAIALCATFLFTRPIKQPIGQASPTDTRNSTTQQRGADPKTFEKREDSEEPLIGISPRGQVQEDGLDQLARNDPSSMSSDPPISKGTTKELNSDLAMKGKGSKVDVDAFTLPTENRIELQESDPPKVSGALRGVVATGSSPAPSQSKQEFTKSEEPPSVFSFDVPALAKAKTEEQRDRSLSEFADYYFLQQNDKKALPDWRDEFVLSDAMKGSRGKLPKKEEATSYLTLRFQKSNKEFKNDTTLALGASRPQAKASVELSMDLSRDETRNNSRDKQTPMDQKRSPQAPLLMEFQIPSEDWTAGAKRLRQLGVDVPLELPNEDVLEFTARPMDAEPPVDASSTASVEKESASPDVSNPPNSLGKRMFFLRIVPKPASELSETEIASKKNPRMLKVLVHVNK